MQNRIEPPILLSRLIIFVFAGTLVVLFVMFMTLEKMFPLNRPEVFFITTRPESASIVQVSELPPNNQNLEAYKQAFVLEYIRARNEIEKNTANVRRKWISSDGMVAAWSTTNVYNTFRKIDIVNAIAQDTPDFVFECGVNFRGRPLQLQNNRYTVNFEYFCKENNGQTIKKDYTVMVELAPINISQIKWSQRLNNPLGLKVAQYVVDGGADPLNTVYR